MTFDFHTDRQAQYEAFQTAFKEYKVAIDEFNARIAALVESGSATDGALDALVLDVSAKHRRWLDLSKPFVR